MAVGDGRLVATIYAASMFVRDARISGKKKIRGTDDPGNVCLNSAVAINFYKVCLSLTGRQPYLNRLHTTTVIGDLPYHIPADHCLFVARVSA